MEKQERFDQESKIDRLELVESICRYADQLKESLAKVDPDTYDVAHSLKDYAEELRTLATLIDQSGFEIDPTPWS
jgi:hypothetical protein